MIFQQGDFIIECSVILISLSAGIQCKKKEDQSGMQESEGLSCPYHGLIFESLRNVFSLLPVPGRQAVVNKPVS